MSSNYAATVVRLNGVRKHSNADRLQCVNIFGNNVIVGLDAKDGDLGLFFPVESQIGPEFAAANDLIRRKDENGKPAGGMFEAHRRVRAITLRGEKSMGFWCPITYLTKTLNCDPSIKGIEETFFQEGQEIETFRGMTISTKYVPRRNSVNEMSAGKQPKRPKKSESRVIPEQFHHHFDTAHLGRNIHRIKPDDLISITWKLHGTSAVTSHVLVKKPLKWYEKALKKIGVNVVDTEYDYLFSSRKVIKNDRINTGPGFYSEDLWTRVGEGFRGKLHKGESVYYEIVGYLADNSYIQKDYDYGCVPGQHKVYIYRITQTNADGVVTELAWNQVVERAKEIGYETVPEIYIGKAVNLWNDNLEEESIERWQEAMLAKLQHYFVHDQDCQFCKNKVPAEGIVLRVEGLNINNYKLKAFRFLKKETEELDTGTVDLETSQAEEINV